MPTAANLNLYGEEGSHVAWHSDVEELFGSRGESKLIVSLSLGSSEEFMWKPLSCLSGQVGSCWLDHGNLSSWKVNARMNSFTARVFVLLANG